MKKLLAVLAIAGFMAGGFASCSKDRCPTHMNNGNPEQFHQIG